MKFFFPYENEEQGKSSDSVERQTLPTLLFEPDPASAPKSL